MPSSSLKFELSSDRKVFLAIGVGIALSVLTTLSAHRGYIPDPFGFLDGSVWDMSTEQSNWFTLTVKAMALAAVLCALLALSVKAAAISSIHVTESTTIVHSPSGKLNLPTAEILLREEKPLKNGDYQVTLQMGSKAAKLSISSYHFQRLGELLSAAKTAQDNVPHSPSSGNGESLHDGPPAPAKASSGFWTASIRIRQPAPSTSGYFSCLAARSRSRWSPATDGALALPFYW